MNATAITPIDQTNDLVVIEPQPIDRNPAAVYLNKLQSKGGRRVQRQALNKIARLLGAPETKIETTNPKTGKTRGEDWTCLIVDWGGLRFQHTQAIRRGLGEQYSHTTANRMLSALRGVLKTAWRLQQMSAEDYQRASDIEGLIGSTVPAGRDLSDGEVTALVKACESDAKSEAAGIRDAAIIGLLWYCGLRRAEVINLDLGDCSHDPDNDGYNLIIHGKRNKERTAYLDNGAACAMTDWLKVRGDEPGPLFYPVNKGGKLRQRRMTSQAVYNMLQKRGEEAGVNNFSPHDFRRTAVSELLDQGVDIATVAGIMGHASVTTTARYDRRPEKKKRKAAARRHYPYHSRTL